MGFEPVAIRLQNCRRRRIHLSIVASKKSNGKSNNERSNEHATTCLQTCQRIHWSIV